jgi:hypothetical protein
VLGLLARAERLGVLAHVLLPSTALLSLERGHLVSIHVHLELDSHDGGLAIALGARPLEHVQLSTNGGGELSTAVTLLLSKFSSVDLRSTDVTLFT